jgi:hypothetical protein
MHAPEVVRRLKLVRRLQVRVILTIIHVGITALLVITNHLRKPGRTQPLTVNLCIANKQTCRPAIYTCIYSIDCYAKQAIAGGPEASRLAVPIAQ